MRHHGLDLVDPDDDFTVTEFQEAADAALADHRRSGRPGAHGGGDRAVPAGGRRRARPTRAVAGRAGRARRHPDTVALHQRLAELDPVGASRMEPTNRRRVVRALEVTVGSGRPFSSFGPGLDGLPADRRGRSSACAGPARCWPSASSSASPRCSPPGSSTRSSAWPPRRAASRGRPRRPWATRSCSPTCEGECSLAEATELAVTRTRQLRRPPAALVPARPPRTLVRDARRRSCRPRPPRASPPLMAVLTLTKHHGLGNDFLVTFAEPDGAGRSAVGGPGPPPVRSAARHRRRRAARRDDGGGTDRSGRRGAQRRTGPGRRRWPTSPCSSTTPTAAGPR